MRNEFRSEALLRHNKSYKLVTRGSGLLHDLQMGHGPIEAVEPRREAMGIKYVQVFFMNNTYTGAEISSIIDARKAFCYIIGYIFSHGGENFPIYFSIEYANLSFNENDMRKNIANSNSKTFPGARAMGLPLKEAVETFIACKYFDRVGNGLTKKDIWREDKRLYEALGSYQRLYGDLPFDIPSERAIVQQQLEKMFREGVDSLTVKERTALSRKAQRSAYPRVVGRPLPKI